MLKVTGGNRLEFLPFPTKKKKKKKQGFLEKWLTPSLEQEIYMMSPEHLVIPESEVSINVYYFSSKGLRLLAEGPPAGQR